MLFFGPLFPVATGHILRVEGFGTEKRNGRCRFDHVRSFCTRWRYRQETGARLSLKRRQEEAEWSDLEFTQPTH